MSVPNVPSGETPEGASPTGRGYWFTPLPVYLLEAVYDPASPVNAPAAILWAHIHRNYAWRERIFPSCARLAEETGTSERTIARLLQALKDAGALTWGAGFSSKGRSSNQYALAPIKAFEFDREPAPPVTDKSGSYSGEPAKSGRHRSAKSGSHPPAKNGRGVKSSSYLESTDESLSPVAAEAEDARERAAVPEERETFSASPDKPTTTTVPAAAVALPGVDVYAAQLAAAAPVPAPRGAATDSQQQGQDRPGGRRAGAGGEVPQQPATTAQRVIRAAAVLADGDDESAFIAWATTRHNVQGGGWWRRVAERGDLPDLVADWRAERAPAATHPAERAMPPWCRDPDCSEIDRMRDREDADGYNVVVRCEKCHPDAIPTRASSGSLADHNRGVLDRYRKRVSSHQPYRDPEDHSVYDLGFDGRPLPGTRPSTADQRAGAAFELAARLERLDGTDRRIAEHAALIAQMEAEENTHKAPLPGTDTTVAGWMAVAAELDGEE